MSACQHLLSTVNASSELDTMSALSLAPNFLLGATCGIAAKNPPAVETVGRAVACGRGQREMHAYAHSDTNQEVNPEVSQCIRQAILIGLIMRHDWIWYLSLI